MRSLLTKIGLPKALGLYVEDDRVTLSQVVATPFGAVETASYSETVDPDRLPEALERLIGHNMDWSPLDQYLVAYLTDPATAATVLASSFAAALEMIREGRLEAHQQGAFSPLYLRKKQNADGALSQGGAAESGNG